MIDQIKRYFYSVAVGMKLQMQYSGERVHFFNVDDLYTELQELPENIPWYEWPKWLDSAIQRQKRDYELNKQKYNLLKLFFLL